MKHLKISDIVGIINKKYPFSLAEDWDNVGLQVGDPSAPVSRIMIALDPLPEVIDEAIELHCDLLITHHPLIFSPLRQITTTTTTGTCVLKAISSNVGLIALHTNYDIADSGLNDILASRIGLLQIKPLKITGKAELVKLVVFVPVEQFEEVRVALLPHAESIGNYRDCSFASEGEGTYLPMEGAQPAIGCVGKQERVAEQRLEMLVKRSQLSRAIKDLLAAHPYEEPAFDCYPLLNQVSEYGLGRIGRLEQPIAAGQFAEMVGRQLGCYQLRLVGDPTRIVSKVAICSGSGASLLRDAVRAGADLLLTGDVKYHEARDAEAQGIALLDAGHFGTEYCMTTEVCRFLEEALKQGGFQAHLMIARCEKDPFIPVAFG